MMSLPKCTLSKDAPEVTGLRRGSMRFAMTMVMAATTKDVWLCLAKPANLARDRDGGLKRTVKQHDDIFLARRGWRSLASIISTSSIRLSLRANEGTKQKKAPIEGTIAAMAELRK